MLRISQDSGQNEGETTHLRLDGQVTGPWVDELRRVCTEALRNNGRAKSPLALNLAGVSFLDANGIALFRELAARGVLFTNGSTFIAEQLKGVADADR